jgi:hypothetical protein
MPVYDDLEIIVQKIGGDANIFAVTARHAARAQQRDASGSFTLDEIKALPSPAQSHATAATRRVDFAGGLPQNFTLARAETFAGEAEARQFGVRLSQALFKTEIAQLWGACKEHSRANRTALRVRLDITRAPELAALPWEYLRAPDDSDYLALDTDCALVRYLRSAEAARPLKIIPPLRILALASAPQDSATLDINAEILNIKQELAALREEFVSVTVLEAATFDNLEKALREARAAREPFHILHFIGHGAFDEAKQEGVLLFEDEQQKSLPVSHNELARLLDDYQSDLRLVVLNACEGARGGREDVFTSVAAQVLRLANLPAAIAMQFSITDQAAIVFARAFYRELAASSPLEQAVGAARRAVSRTQTGLQEWGTPVLYLRADNGQLLDLRAPTIQPALKGHYDALREALPNSKLVFFLGLNVNTVGRPAYERWRPEFGLPSADELCAYIAGELLKLPQQAGSLASLAQQLGRNHNLRHEFRTIFQPPVKVSSLYRFLGGLAKKVTDRLAQSADICHNGLLFVTTTYDNVLENAFAAAGLNEYHLLCYGQDENEHWLFTHRHYRERQLVATTPLDAANPPNTYLGLSSQAPVILKLPGEAGSEGGFAVTEDDFIAISRRDLSELIPANILTQLQKSRHLYIGYDLQYWPLRLLWHRICEGQNKFAKRESYAVVFDKDLDPNAPFWGGYGINFAIANLEDYVAGLEQLVLQKLP